MVAPLDAGRASLATDRYELISELATSPLGPLWAARTLSGDEQGRLVAIRRLTTRGMDPARIARLLDDARMALDVRHVGVVATLDVLHEKERVSIVSEYVEGESLASLLDAAIERQSPFPVSVALRISLDIVRALCAAKQQWRGGSEDFPHGGLLPHSMLVAGFGEAMISDLGASRAVLELQSVRDDQACQRYRAPEPRAPDPSGREAADVYTMGAVLWEMLANQRLPASATALAELERAGPPIPRAIAQIVERALQPETEARLSTLDELLRALSEPPIELAPPEQLVLTLDRLARPKLEARRARLRAPLRSERPDESPPSNRPTLEPAAIVVRRSERPTIHSIDELAFSEHEQPTRSERQGVEPNRALAIVSARPARPLVVRRAEQLEPDSLTSRPKAWWLGLVVLAAAGLVGAVLLTRGGGDAAEDDARAKTAASRENSRPAASPRASALTVDEVASATAVPVPRAAALPVASTEPSAQAAAPPAPPLSAPTSPKPARPKRDGEAFRPHGP